MLRSQLSMKMIPAADGNVCGCCGRVFDPLSTNVPLELVLHSNPVEVDNVECYYCMPCQKDIQEAIKALDPRRPKG